MKHVKLFEAWMDDSQTIDLSKFAGDVSSEGESIFVFHAEDVLYSVLADTETCMQLEELSSGIDREVLQTKIFNTPGASFVGMDSQSGELLVLPSAPEGMEGVNLWILGIGENESSPVELGDGGEPKYYLFPLKRGAATMSRQASNLYVVSIPEFIDFVREMAESFPAQ